MGWVETLKSGRHRGVARDPKSGRRWSKTFDRWPQANAWWQSEERLIDADYADAGIDVSRQRRNVPSFDDFAADWARRSIPDAKRSTLRNHRSCAAILGRRWEGQPVDQITEDHILDYLADLRDQDIAPGTVRGRLAVLRHIMAKAANDGLLSEHGDPTQNIKGPKHRRLRARILSDHELMAILDCLPPWLRCAPLLGHDGGLRTGEVAGLHRCNLDMVAGIINVVDVVDVNGAIRDHPKYGESRSVPMSPRLLDAIQNHLNRYRPTPSETIFRNPLTGTWLHTHRIWWEWRRAVEAAQVPPVRPRFHDLRHNYATKLARGGANPLVIRDLLGHRDLDTTMIYVNEATSLQDQIDAVRRIFGNAS